MNRDETAQDEDNVTSDESTEEEVVSEDSAPEEAASDDTTEEEDSPSEEAAGSDYRPDAPSPASPPRSLLQGIQEHGYAEATPVQAQGSSQASPAST